MGRHKRKGNWKEKREKAKKQNTQPKENYESFNYVLDNKALEAYYKVTIILL